MTKIKIRPNNCSRAMLLVLLTNLLAGCNTERTNPNTVNSISALSALSIETLRERDYSSQLSYLTSLSPEGNATDEYREHYARDGHIAQSTHFLGYVSDGLSVYTRIDIPDSPLPPAGYPILIFSHGWIGAENAANYDFGYNTTSLYGEIIDRYTDLGYVVLTPGYRGHGTYNEHQADGFDYISSWDNASLLSPSFYAIDVINLIAAVPSLTSIPAFNSVTFNTEGIFLAGHSQGGDVALTVAAILGEGKSVGVELKAVSIWAGCIADRFQQSEIYAPMSNTRQAFMSGDGEWTGSAIGKNGEINHHFVFGFPQDWIETVDTKSEDWSWQADVFTSKSVNTSRTERFQSMYEVFRQQVASLQNLEEFTYTEDDQGVRHFNHSQQLDALYNIGGFNKVAYLSEPLNLHFADQDYYSIPEWNFDLASRVNASGGQAHAYQYDHNNHSLKVSRHRWFSPEGTQAGINQAIERDHALFHSKHRNSNK